MRRRFILLFLIPLGILLISAQTLSRLNRERIKAEFESLTLAEGMTIQQLLEISGQHLAEGGKEELTAYLAALYQNEAILYIGLFQGERLIHLLSRFEDYFPVVHATEAFHIIDSPLGKVLDIRSRFVPSQGQPMRLHIGFHYDFLTRFENAAHQNFTIMIGLFAFISLFVILLILYFEKRQFNHRLQLEKIAHEREHFRELSLLTAGIAHEIKNPLNAVSLSFSAIEPHLAGSPEALYYRDAVRSEIQRITAIINSYSEQAREIRPVITPLDMGSLLKEIQWLLQQEFTRDGLTVTLADSGPITFDSDAALLRQVLINLLKNAHEAGARHISIGALFSSPHLILTVSDDGPGIKAELRQQIFKPFFSTKNMGMGLGLHIVSRILHALGGTIELTNADPGATRFTIRIPERPSK